jgi:hypothetical protein
VKENKISKTRKRTGKKRGKDKEVTEKRNRAKGSEKRGVVGKVTRSYIRDSHGGEDVNISLIDCGATWICG